MSLVTNVLLSFSGVERGDSRIAEIAEWLLEHDQLPFKVVGDACVGGAKRLEAPVYAAAFNYFTVEDFLAYLRTVDWAEPENVQVFVRGPDADRWTVMTL